MGQSVSGLKQEDIEAMMKATNCEHFFPIFPFFFSLSHISQTITFFFGKTQSQSTSCGVCTGGSRSWTATGAGR